MKIKKIAHQLNRMLTQSLAYALLQQQTCVQIVYPERVSQFQTDLGNENYLLISNEQFGKIFYCLLRYRQSSYFKCQFKSYQQLTLLISLMDNIAQVIPNNSNEMDNKLCGFLAIVDGNDLLQNAFKGKLIQYFQNFLQRQKFELNMGGLKDNRITVFWSITQTLQVCLSSRQYQFSILGVKDHERVTQIMKSKIQDKLKYTYQIQKVGFNNCGDLTLNVLQQIIINNQTSKEVDKLKIQWNKCWQEYQSRQNKFNIMEQESELTKSYRQNHDFY